MARVIPFPILRRRAFVSRQIEMIASMTKRGAERYITNQCQAQIEAMRRKQIDKLTIAREVASLESVLRGGPTPVSSGAA